MSKINIENLIKQSTFKSNIYLPIIEGVINSLDAIEDSNRVNTELGYIIIEFKRESTLPGTHPESLPNIESVTIEDNGIGFNDENKDAFDTLYTEKKIAKGGKGFGRIMFKKHFQKIFIESVFYDDKSSDFKKRNFIFGKHNIVAKESITNTEDTKTWSKISLETIISGHFDKKLQTISKRILENILPYFINEDYQLPKIILKDEKSSDIILNELYNNNEFIKNIETKTFKLTNSSSEENIFTLYIFKVYSPKNQKSTISLVANKREVTSSNISDYIPEFEDEFYEPVDNKNFIIKTYVLGQYLDENVELERMSFKFSKKSSDLFFDISQEDIEREVSKIIEKEFTEDLTPRREKKETKVNNYIKENPWFSEYKKDIDWYRISMNPSEEEIENHLHSIRYKSERHAKYEINKILKNTDDDFEEKLNDVFKNLDKAKQSELAHYVSLRKVVLDILKKLLEKDNKEKYSTESIIHNIIFPIKKDSNEIMYKDHNLWVLDERLSFTDYLTSDKPIFESSGDKPDIFCFDKKIVFRGENEPSNPITIFEFKRPGRDDFVNTSSKEDPYDQIIRYIKQIKDGELKTYMGRPINIGNNTPYYGYIISDLNGKIKEWLDRKDFSSAPDANGYFRFHNKYNLYTEFISWDKLLKDAEMRNKIFFHKLGI